MVMTFQRAFEIVQAEYGYQEEDKEAFRIVWNLALSDEGQNAKN